MAKPQRYLRLFCPQCESVRESPIAEDPKLSPVANPVTRLVHVMCNECLARRNNVSLEMLNRIDKQ